MGNAVLFQYGRHVSLGDVIGEGAVTEGHLGIAGEFQLIAPVDDALGEGFDFVTVDRFIETGEKDTVADAVNGLAGDLFLFNGYGQIIAALQEQFIENILFAAAFDQVLGVVEQGLFQVVSVRIPGADVSAVEFEDFENEVSGVVGMLFSYFMCCSTDTPNPKL